MLERKINQRQEEKRYQREALERQRLGKLLKFQRENCEIYQKRNRNKSNREMKILENFFQTEVKTRKLLEHCKSRNKKVL